MDISFIAVTIFFILFLIISYYLNVFKLSTPLVLIYLVFCFNYLINEDVDDQGNDYLIDLNKQPQRSNELNPTKKTQQNINYDSVPGVDRLKINDNKSIIPTPIVSSNPKPIIIDSNLIIQKDTDDKILKISKELDTNQKVIIDKLEKEDNKLKLNEIMICRGVYKRNPIKPGFEFKNNVDSLFCYTKISNSGSKQEIKHLWFFKEKLITSVTYNIKTSYNYRSWSKKTILPSQLGQWRVDVVDVKNNVLGSREFTIKSLNNGF